MRVELIDTIANASVPGQVVEIEGPVSISEILFFYEGENKAGHTAAAADDLGGMLNVKEIGVGTDLLHDIVSLTRPQFLMTYWEAFFGYFHEVSVDEGAYSMMLPLPFHVGKYDHNSLFVPPNYRLQIQVPTIDEAGTELDNCSCTVMARTNKRYHTRFIPRIFQQRVDLAAANRDGIPEGSGVLIATASSANEPDSINFMQGTDRKIYLDRDAAYALYQTINMMEAAPTMVGDIVYDFTDMGYDLTENVGADWFIETINGTGYLELMTFGIDQHHPARMAASRRWVQDGVAHTRRRAELVGIVPEMHREALIPALPGGSSPSPQIINPQGQLSPARQRKLRSMRASKKNRLIDSVRSKFSL